MVACPPTPSAASVIHDPSLVLLTQYSVASAAFVSLVLGVRQVDRRRIRDPRAAKDSVLWLFSLWKF